MAITLGCWNAFSRTLSIKGKAEMSTLPDCFLFFRWHINNCCCYWYLCLSTRAERNKCHCHCKQCCCFLSYGTWLYQWSWLPVYNGIQEKSIMIYVLNVEGLLFTGYIVFVLLSTGNEGFCLNVDFVSKFSFDNYRSLIVFIDFFSWTIFQ